MSDPTDEVDRLDNRYRSRFAGHARVTRDADDLAEMIVKLDALNLAGTALAERGATLRAQWTDELSSIRAMQAMPFAIPAARLRNWADLTMSRYARSFAGQDRRTRDVGLLVEIRADLKGVRDAMGTLARSAPQQELETNLPGVDQQLKVYETEIEAIRTSRRTGTPAEQGTRLAQLANEQFETYEWHFAGKARASRHPATLERIVGSLEEIRRGMQSLSLSGFNDPSNTRNQGIVDGRLRSFSAELDAIRRVRLETPVEQRATALGAAANDVFTRYRADYAGKSRKDVNPGRLNQLFELLWPIAREMDEIDADHDVDGNTDNLRLVMDSLVMYAREFDAIRAAKAEVKA